MFRTGSRPTHRAPGRAQINYRELTAPVGRGVGGAALLSAVAATGTFYGAPAAEAAGPQPATGNHASAGYPDAKLRQGSRGSDVRFLQERLNAGGANLKVDGVFGRATANAVRALQSNAGIGVDAVVGPKTWNALKNGTSAQGSAPAGSSSASASTSQSVPTSKLRQGSRGSDVRFLQERLNASGANLKVDGVFGRATANAVRALQSNAGIGVDAVVGPKTWNALMGGTSAQGSAPAGSSSASASRSSSFPGQSIVNMAMQQQGVRYKWGGSSPAQGMDCSGLVKYVYNAHGIDVPRTARQQTFAGRIISQSEARPGDLVAFSDRNWGHIGIYAGNGKIIDASGSRQQVLYRNIWNSPHVFVTYR